MNSRTILRIIWLIFLSGLGVRALWVYIVPVWQQADEYPHFYYVQHLHKYRGFPISRPVFPYYEGYQPPMYYVIAAGVYSLFPSLDEQREQMGETVEVNFRSTDYQKENNSMALQLRWLSVLFWSGTFWVAVLFFRKFIWDKTEVSVLGLSFLAFLPTLVSNSSSITNDSLAVFLATLFIYLMMQEKIRLPNYLFLLGLILGWGVLTKYNNLILIPVLVGSVVLFHRSSTFRILLPLLGIAAVMVFPWFKFTGDTYGMPLAMNPGYETSQAINGQAGTTLLVSARNLFWSFWAAAGRAYEIHLPVWWYVLVFGGMTILAVLGLVKLFVRVRSSAGITSFQFNLIVLFFIAAVMLIVASLWYSLSYQIMTSWGKNLYVLILPIAILFSVGWTQISAGRIWVITPPMLLFVTNIVYPFGLARHYYHG